MTDTTPRSYTQHEREVLLAAWMDITADRFREVLPSLDRQVLKALDDQPISGYIVEIADGSKDPNAQLMWQAVAATSDTILHGMVQAFGTDPLEQAGDPR